MNAYSKTTLALALSMSMSISITACGGEEDDANNASSENNTAGNNTAGGTNNVDGDWTCEAMAALFVNTPETTSTQDCSLSDGSTATCCNFTFGSDLVEDGPYCPGSKTSPAPYGLSVYDGATNPGLRPFNGDYLQDIEDDGYDPMVDDDGNTNIVTSLQGGASDGSNCLAIDQDGGLTIEVNVPLNPKMASAATTLREVENLGVSIHGVPSTGDPPSATMGPSMGGPGGGDSTAINVPSIGSCGAHPDPGGYLHDHFIPQVMNSVLAAQGIGTDEVECTRYTQTTTGLYGFAKDGHPIYSSRDSEGEIPGDLDACQGHTSATDEFPDGVYHYHASETAAPNFMSCLSGVAVSSSFSYR